MHPALWISKTGLDAQTRDILSFQITWLSKYGVLRKAVRCLKTFFIKISINPVVVHRLTLNYQMV